MNSYLLNQDLNSFQPIEIKSRKKNSRNKHHPNTYATFDYLNNHDSASLQLFNQKHMPNSNQRNHENTFG